MLLSSFLLLGAQMWWENSPKLDVGMCCILCELFTNIITIDPIYGCTSCSVLLKLGLLSVSGMMITSLFLS
jgi:hypothetical protein